MKKLPPLDPSSCPIVYISPYYVAKQTSGANRRFNEVCERMMRDYGDRFHLVVAKGQKPSWWNGKNLVEVDYRFDHPSKFTAAAEIGRYLDTLPPSLAIIESLPIPFRALKRHRHFQVAYDFRYFRKESKSFLYRLLFSQYLKQQWGDSEYMVTCSEFSIRELEKYVKFPRERVVKSFFGIDERVFDTPKSSEKKWDLIYVSHFEKRKNHEPLIRAIALHDKNLKTLFVGQDNGLRASLEALASLALRT
jgi:glycosyltransferase involved in cell wall biosynthesis